MIRYAKRYGRYGYRKVTELLRIEGWNVNHKKVERLWREEGLKLPERHKKRRRLYHKESSVIRLRPTHPNHVCAMDFVHDRLSNGRSYKMLTVLDEYTRQALCVEVRDKIGSDDVLEVMHRLLMKHGKLHGKSSEEIRRICQCLSNLAASVIALTRASLMDLVINE